MTTPLDHSLAVLACPLCGSEFAHVDKAFRCTEGHVFDLARHGYASLTTGGGPHFSGDTAPMVADRDAFLSAGHYAPIAAALAANAPQQGWCVEIAGGTGYYLSQVLNAQPDLRGVTIDVSKPAARVAARAQDRLASVTGDARALLPIRTASVDLVLSVFGPRRGDEVARVLAPGGSAIVVTPRSNHLIELRERFSLLAIGADKEERLRTALLPLVLDHATELDFEVNLSQGDVVNAIMMGPNAFHQTRTEVEALAAAMPEGQATTIAVTVSHFRAGG